MQTLGERLAALRKDKGLSQAELAKLLNMGQSTIAMYEKNRRTPDPATLKRLADFFNVSVDYILGRTDNPKGPEGEPWQQQGQPVFLREENLQYLVADRHFAALLERIPDLTEEEKESLAEYWEWALRVIEKERRRRAKSPPDEKDPSDAGTS